jgi:hypothetical protein
MNKIVFTIIFFWILWKVLKSVLEEIQKRMEDQGLGGREGLSEETPERDQQQLRTRPSAGRPTAPTREPQEWSRGDPVPGEEESELEHWFREAMEHKQRMEDATLPSSPPGQRAPPEPARPQAAQPRPAQPRAARPQPARPRGPVRRVEPRIEHRREARVERQRVVHPSEPVVPTAVEHREAPPAAPRPRKGRRERTRAPRRKRAGADLAGIGGLDLHDVRRGIILAEILGPAKGLGDIDSHVI